MKNQRISTLLGILLLASPLIITTTPSATMAEEHVSQVNSSSSVPEDDTIKPTDWEFQQLRILNDRYSCFDPELLNIGYREGSVTRQNFAVGLSFCLDRLHDLIQLGYAADISREELALMQRLQEEFASELAIIRGQIDALAPNLQPPTRTGEEYSQWSSNTPLDPEAYGLSLPAASQPETQPSFITPTASISTAQNITIENITIETFSNFSEPFLALEVQTPPLDRESYNLIEENSFLRAIAHPLSTFGIDVDPASYSNMRRFITGGHLPPRDAIRIEELINYFSYDYPDPRSDRPFSIITEVAQSPWSAEHQLVHIGLQSKRIDTDELPPNNLVFLLDVSGSMNSPDKLPLLKSAFRLLVDELRDDDQVSIVVYAGAAGIVLPPTSGRDKATILAAIEQLQAGGSTAGGEGIQLAYNLAQEHFVADGNNRVILATDGDFNVGISSESELVQLIEDKRRQDVFLTVLGFGTGNLQDSKMEQLANHGNGNYAYIDTIREAEKVLVSEMGGTLLTIAKDVKLQVEFNPEKVQAYRLIGYENRVLANEEFNDDTKDSGDLGAGHSVTALYEIIPVGVDPAIAIPDVDDLRYQQVTIDPDAALSDELLQVKLRYKEPTEDESTLLTRSLTDEVALLERASDNLKFSAAVAAFGMILRNSDYKGTANLDLVQRLTEETLAFDPSGYRSEFLDLVKTYESIVVGARKSP